MMTTARKNGLGWRRLEVLEWIGLDTAGLFGLNSGFKTDDVDDCFFCPDPGLPVGLTQSDYETGEHEHWRRHGIRDTTGGSIASGRRDTVGMDIPLHIW